MSRSKGKKIVGNPESSLDMSVSLDHPNILLCSGTDMSGSRTFIYRDYEFTLTHYIEGYINPLVNTFTIPFNQNATHLNFSYAPLSYSYISESFRKIIKGAIEGILYLHRKERTLESLTIDNFVVDNNGEVKLCGLKLRSHTVINAQKDFLFLGNVLYRLFGKDAPDDVADLVRCMCNYRNPSDDILLLNHLAVLTTDERIRMIKNFSEKESFIIEAGKYNVYGEIFNQMNRDERDLKWSKWITKFEERAAVLGPALDCYENEPSRSSSSARTTNHMKANLSYSAIKEARNMATRMWIHGKKYGRNNVWQDSDTELVVMCIFGKYLLSFQKKACDRQILSYLV